LRCYKLELNFKVNGCTAAVCRGKEADCPKQRVKCVVSEACWNAGAKK
jgi:hypothetical protein